MTDTMEKGAFKVLNVLLLHGYEAYLVGGCVRDKQLNRTVKDYDIATSARPDQVQGLFERTIPTGLQHGTVSVIMDGILYEVTTFRQEAVYEQFRRPSEVHFIENLYEDLQRRDFTMNAMALDLNGHLIDPFDGMQDITNGILRCVGDANERFSEDALRMLRCIRFSAEFELEVEQNTWAALCRQAGLLKHIAMERVRMELERMIAGAHPDKALDLLVSSGILKHAKTALQLTKIGERRPCSRIVQLAEPYIRWAYLFLCVGMNKAEIQADMRALTFSKIQTDQTTNVAAAAYKLRDAWDKLKFSEETNINAKLEMIWKQTAITFGKDVLLAVNMIVSVDPEALVRIGVDRSANTVLAEGAVTWSSELVLDRLEQLQIGGKQLLEHISKPPGPWLAGVLDHLLRQAALGRLPNDQASLAAEAKRWIAHNNPKESGTK